ncbi:LPS translocon maturation chaperone LptM [Candidatus Skiveiella danica]|uniref:LPS translocon maturation chaperone LptM n=1 Tax=Candidatus Skiveiella danica TaxID=3386177 RepID=UPI0039B85473
MRGRSLQFAHVEANANSSQRPCPWAGAVVLAGCGQKGPLILPHAPASAASMPSTRHARRSSRTCLPPTPQ